MDKFTNSIWFSRLIALAIAGLLFTSVNFESKLSNDINTPGQDGTETVENVPVEVHYDQENLVVTGAPETVDVKLEGVKSLLLSARSQRDFKVYIDLSDPEITMGTKKVPIKIGDLNDKLKATITPSYATVTVQERVTKEFSVDVEYNQSLLEEGYTAEKPAVNPQTVKITGAKDVINQISYVKATLGLTKGVTENVNKEATVRALDRDLNKLDVTIEPAQVNVSLKVNIPSKTVPIRPVQQGRAPEGLRIKSITAEDKSVTVYGKESVLAAIKEVEVPVDVSVLKGNTEAELPLSIPDDIHTISQTKVKVSIQTEKVKLEEKEKPDPEDEPAEETQAPQQEEEKEEQEEAEKASEKTFTAVPIRVDDLADSREMEFLEPENGKIDVTLTGSKADLNQIKKADIQLSISLSKLREGEHDVKIRVQAPNGVEWKLSSANVKVKIADTEEEETSR